MRLPKLMWALAFVFLFTVCIWAQPKPGTIVSTEFQTPKPGMEPQYEQGRKAKAQWHRQQNDPQPLWVWQVVSGDGTGTYLVERVNQHWADFDKPPVSEDANLALYNKEIGPYVGSLVTRYYNFMITESTMSMQGTPMKYAEVVAYRVKWGHEADFRTAIARVTEAAQKTKWPVQFGWFELVNGGPAGEFVLVVPKSKWADFEQSGVKPFRDMLKDGLGQSESDSVMRMFDTSVEGATSEVLEFRQDLSYLPGK